MRNSYFVLLVIAGLISCGSDELSNDAGISKKEEKLQVADKQAIPDTAKKIVYKIGEDCTSDNSALISIKVNDLEASIKFYTNLGWRRLEDKSNENYAVMYDGSSILALNPYQEKKMKYVYHLTDDLFQKYFDSIQPLDYIDGSFAASLPDSLYVEFINSKQSFPCTQNMQVVLETGDYMNLPMHNEVLGCYAELAMNYDKVEEAMDITERLGFKNNGLQSMPYKWVAMSDGLALLSYHNTQEWTGMNITYFGKDNDQKAENLKEKGIILEPVEMGGQVLPGNYIIEDPDGNKIFMFQLF
jgi:hypothetical protein